MDNQSMNEKYFAGTGIFPVIFYFIILIFLGGLFYFVPPLRITILIAIAIVGAVFIKGIIYFLDGIKDSGTGENMESDSGFSGKEKFVYIPERTIDFTIKELQSGICVKCGGRFILKRARQGKYKGSRFYRCSNYPKCRNTIIIPDDKTEKESNKPTVKTSPKCPNCETEMVIRVSRRGTSEEKSFYGCINYPECRRTIDIE